MESTISPQLRQDIMPTNDYVRQLDKQTIPEFLAHLRDGQVSKQHVIQQYEVIARDHGKTIIPYIGEIMSNVLKVLSSDCPSLQEACAKVVSALARYTIDPSSLQGQKEEVLRELSTPLLEVLLGNLQSMAEGAAICLRSLVETETWKFAPQDIVNDVCLRVTGALEEKGTQTVAHMKLVGALIKRNGLILEAYGRSLLKAATRILDSEVWQIRLHAVQMINTLMQIVDFDILASEIPNAITSLERVASDRMPSIKKSASETLKFAKAMASEMGMEVPYVDGCGEVGSLYQDILSPDMNSFANPSISSLRSTSSRNPTPSVVGSVARDKRCYPFHANGGFNSDSIDECSLSRRRDSTISISSRLSNSITPNTGADTTAAQTSYFSLNNRGKEGGSQAYVVGRSQFFDKDDYRRRHSIGTDMSPDIDSHKVVQYDPGVYQRRFSLGYYERLKGTRSTMHGQIGGDVDRREYLERKHCYKENGDDDNASFSFRINSHQSPCPSDVDEEETDKLEKAGSLMRMDDMKPSSTQRTLVRFGNHSTPVGTSRKRQQKTEYTDVADGHYDESNELRGENSGRMSVALKGRALLDRLESVADGYSDRSNSQEGSMLNSSVWSESVERSDSLSRTSSGTPFQDMSCNEAAYLTLSTELERSHNLYEMMESCQLDEDDSVEVSVDSSELEETSTFRRGWEKVSNFMESILGGSLCIVLAVPATMVAVKLLTMQEEYHVMVPT